MENLGLLRLSLLFQGSDLSPPFVLERVLFRVLPGSHGGTAWPHTGTTGCCSHRSRGTYMCSIAAPAGSGFCAKWGKEQAVSRSGCGFSARQRDVHSASLGGAGREIQSLPCALPAGQESPSVLWLLRLMASAILVVRLGHLHLREFQFWVAMHRLDPTRHGARRLLVTPECTLALRHWRASSFAVQAGAVFTRVRV